MAEKSAIEVEIEGIQKVSDKMEQVVKDLTGSPMEEGMREATMLVTRDARIFAPVDTGRLRASIAPEVTVHGKEVRGVVGSNVKYAPYVETGTKPHWPPPGALAVWAERHGIPEFLVRRSIGTFGTSVEAERTIGTKGWRYLQRAFEQNRERIITLIGDVVGKIVSK